MDKNTLIGFSLIGLLLLGFSYLNRPTAEQMDQIRHKKDSIAAVSENQTKSTKAATLANGATENALLDSAKIANVVDSTAIFAKQMTGEESFSTLENELFKLVFSNKGGAVSSVVLKKHKGQDKQPLVLFGGDESQFNFFFYTKNEQIQSKDYYFTPTAQTDSTLTMRLQTTPESYLDFIYTIHPNSYMVDYSIQAINLNGVLSNTANRVDIEWKLKARQHEKGYKFENKYSNITFKYDGDDTDYLSETKNDQKSVSEKLFWIGYKSQFFTSVFIADKNFEGTELKSNMEVENSGYLKNYQTATSAVFDPTGQTATRFHFYFGPNHYNTLKALDQFRADDDKLELDKLVPLGWSLFRWVNKLFTIPMFDYLYAWFANMGIVILLMTLVIKLLIYRLTYKSYISSARMRVLRPKVDELSKKYPKPEDSRKKQSETMALYSSYGVSPMSGCLPMLLQMPILVAMFYFVPTAIELRQQSFLWADDLSTYDAIYTWSTQIPLISSVFGNHLSLFCILMTITNLLNTKYMMSAQDTGQQQIPGMKYMMYAMPVMFLFIFNDYASGLTYYYFLSTLISVLTTFILRKTTDEEKLLAKLEAYKKNPKKKKGGFMAKLQEAQKEQERKMANAKKGKK